MQSREVQPRKVLIVEDDPQMLSFLRVALEGAGLLVVATQTAKAAATWIKNRLLPDLVLLDRGLPDMDGLEFCKALKRSSETRAVPVIVLTARSDNSTRLAAKAAEADLCLHKPIRPDELLRAAEELMGMAGGLPPMAGPLHRDGLEVDPRKGRAFFNGSYAHLSNKLFQTLYVLVLHCPRTVSREDIVEFAAPGKQVREADVLICLLRKSLRRQLAADLIETVSRIGYRLVVPAGITPPDRVYPPASPAPR